MQPLFVGRFFSDVMNANLQKMTSEIEQLKCADLLNKTDDELEQIAEKYTNKYVLDDIPTLALGEIRKITNERLRKHLWEVPFNGNVLYFKLSPSSTVLGQYVDDIQNEHLTISLDSRFSDFNDAEADATKRLNQIVATLQTFRDDVARGFSRQTLQRAALTTVKRVKENCTSLVKPGYTMR